jgi:hypothetical protein
MESFGNSRSVIADTEFGHPIHLPHGDGNATLGTVMVFHPIADQILKNHLQVSLRRGPP